MNCQVKFKCSYALRGVAVKVSGVWSVKKFFLSQDLRRRTVRPQLLYVGHTPLKE